MTSTCSFHALIPARSGSKGVTRKNTRLIAGKPLITWTLECALLVKSLSSITVSSDDDLTERITRGYDVLFIRRNPTLSSDTARMVDVVTDYIEQMSIPVNENTYIILLQPTSPLRIPSDIIAACQLIIDNRPNSLISVTNHPDIHPARMYRISNSRLDPYNNALSRLNRQELDSCYFRNGSIYIFSTQYVINHKLLWDQNPLAYVMPHERSINIDTPYDFMVADALLTLGESH